MQLLDINWYQIFYWLTVSDSVKKFFDTTSNIFSWFAILSFVFMVVCKVFSAVQISEDELKNEEEEKVNPTYRAWVVVRKLATPVFYVFLTLSILTWVGYVFTPTKKDCLLIVTGGAVGNFLTKDSSAKALPADLTSYLHLSIQKEISELNSNDVALPSKKKTFLDKAKDLTKEELYEAIKNDTSFSK